MRTDKNVFAQKSFFVSAFVVSAKAASQPSPFRTRPQAGFTMLELVVVVAILAVIASAAIMSFGNTASDAQIETARYSMKQIAGAVEAYYEDNKNHPNALSPSTRFSPADLGFLFDASQAENAPAWNPDYRQGWRGPYLKQAQYMYVDIGDDLMLDGSSRDDSSIFGLPHFLSGSGNEFSNMIAVADPYEHFPVDDGIPRSSGPCKTNDCLFEWQKRIDQDNPLSDDADGDGNPDTLSKFGRPYLIIDLLHMNSDASGAGVPRIVSLGANGIYEPLDCDYSEDDPLDADYCSHDVLCDSAGDDLVLCLR